MLIVLFDNDGGCLSAKDPLGPRGKLHIYAFFN